MATTLKSCPSCGRTYSDMSLSFCLEDGRLLSASFESGDFELTIADNEKTTVLRSSNEQVKSENRKPITINRARKHELDLWKYEKSKRTAESFPTLNSPPVSGRPRSKWTSSDFVREITFHVTGRHTFHAQENLEILRDFLNNHIEDPNKILRKWTWANGVGSFYSYEGCFWYNFQKKESPSKENFLSDFHQYLNR